MLERMSFTCSRMHDCYFLEPSAELPEEAPVSAAYESLSPTSSEKRCTPEFRRYSYIYCATPTYTYR